MPAIDPTVTRHKRSKAWFYYAVIAVFGVVAAFGDRPIGLIATLIAAPYSVYLYRGGRVVIWFW